MLQLPEIKLTSGRIFLLGLHPLADRDSRRMVVHVSEVTEQRRMLEQVSRSEKMATVGKLASGLAHEINNPLGVILCYAELLKQAARPEQMDDLDVIIRHTRQAREVLRSLLDFARPKATTGRHTDIRATAEAVTRVFTVQAEKRRATIRLESDGEIPPVNSADPQMVEQIMANLLLNALDALPVQDGQIIVALRYDTHRDEVVLTVSDNGSGLAKDDLPHIFDPFFTTKEAGKGVGLGLTVIYGFLQDLGGRVEAFNNPEGGACFVLHFPKEPAERGSRTTCSWIPQID
jgi:signal transduction histidine kinase